MSRWQAARRPRNVAIAIAVVALAGLVSMTRARGGSLPNVPMADVVTGDFVDTLEIRGDIRPLKSLVLDRKSHV